MIHRSCSNLHSLTFFPGPMCQLNFLKQAKSLKGQCVFVVVCLFAFRNSFLDHSRIEMKLFWRSPVEPK